MCLLCPLGREGQAPTEDGEGRAENPEQEEALPWWRVGSTQAPPALKADGISEGKETSNKRGN